MSNPNTSAKPSVDELVLQLFEKVQQKQRDIAASEKPQWVTSCSIGLEEDGVKTRVNIQTVSDPAKLVEVLGALLAKQAYWIGAASLLGVKLPFKWMGYTVEQWTKDFKTRLAQIELVAKRAELKALEARLDKLITTDQRRELELAAIQKEMEGSV